MAFCAITDTDKLNVAKITNHILNRNIDSLSDFKNLSKTAYQIMVSKNATPEKAATLVTFIPQNIANWRDRRSEIGDPIDKKYKDLINSILEFSKNNLTDYNSVLDLLDIKTEVVNIPEIAPLSEQQVEVLSQIDEFISNTEVTFKKERDGEGNFISRRSINGVPYDIRVTDISVIGYYEYDEKIDKRLVPALKHGDTIDLIAKEIFTGIDNELYQVTGRENRINEKSFNAIKEHFLRIKNFYQQKGFTFRTGVTVYDPVTKISGEIDLILIDKEGKMYIADVKTLLGNYTYGRLSSSIKFEGRRRIKKLSKENNYSTQMYVYALLLDKMFPGKVDTKNFTVLGVGLQYDNQVLAYDSIIDEIVNVDTLPVSKVREEYENMSLDQIRKKFDSMVASNYKVPLEEVVEDNISEPTVESKIVDVYERSIIDRVLGKYEYSKSAGIIFFNKSVAYTSNDISNQEKFSIDPIRALVLKDIEKRKKSEKDNAENIRSKKLRESFLNNRDNIAEQTKNKQEITDEYDNTIKEIDERYSKEIETIGRPVDTSKIFRPGRRSLDRIKLIDELTATSEELKVEIDWLKSTYGEKIVLKLFDAVNSELNGQVSLNIVKLWKNASIGTGYHEGWHVFSQLFLTMEEKEKLYNSVKKSGTPIQVRRAGGIVETINSKDATYLEIEEFLADEFAKYGLSPQNYNFKKLFKKESETPNNIFEKLWNLLKRMFDYVTGRDGRYSRRKIEIYFNDLKVGALSNYKYSLKNNMFQSALNSVSSSLSKQEEIISPDRMHLYAKSIDTIVRKELLNAGRVFTSFNSSAKLRRDVFTNVYIELLDRLEGKGKPLTDLQEVEIKNILENWPEFLSNYKKYSFYSSIRKFAIEDEVAKHNIKSDLSEGNSDDSMIDQDIENQNDQNDTIEEGPSKMDKFDVAANDESPISKAEKAILDYLMSVPVVKYIDKNTGEIVLEINELGYEVGSDPYDLFHRLKKRLSGKFDLNLFIKELDNPATQLVIPEAKIIAKDIKRILSNLLTDSPTSTKRTDRIIEEFTFLQSFTGALSLPEVMNTQLTVDYYSMSDKQQSISTRFDKKIVNYEVLTRSLSQKIINRWKKDFEDPRTKVLDPENKQRLKKEHFTSESFNDENFDIFDAKNTLYISNQGTVYLNIFAFNEENKRKFLGKSLADLRRFFSLFSIEFDQRVFESGEGIERLMEVRDSILISLSELEKVSEQEFINWAEILINSKYRNRKEEIQAIIADNYDKTTKDKGLVQALLKTKIISPSDINLLLTQEGLGSEKVSLRNITVPGFTTSPIGTLTLNDNNYKYDVDGKTTKIISITNHYYDFRDLADIQAQYGDDITSGSFRIDNRTKYPYYNPTQLLLVTNLLNQVENKSDIKNNPQLQHIDPELPWLRNNLFLNSLFNTDGKRTVVNGEKVQLIVEDIASFKTIDIKEVNGVKQREYKERRLSDVSATEKTFIDILTLLKYGVIENRRAETSPSMMAFRLSSYNGKNINLPISPKLLTGSKNTNIMSVNKVSEYMQNLLISELQKMFWYNLNYGDQLMKFSEELNLFQDILPQELIDKLKVAGQELLDGSKELERLGLIFSDKYNDLKIEFTNSVNKYFEKEISLLYNDLINKKLYSAKERSALSSTMGAANISMEPIATAFIINRFILRSEFDSLIFGDLYHYSNPFKRGKNITNHGYQLYIDSMRNDILNRLNPTSLHSISQNKLKADHKDYSIIKTMSVKDIVMESIYFKSGKMFNNINRVREALGIPSMLNNEFDLKFGSYGEIKVTDGQGIIGLDFYKALALVAKIWTPEMQDEYNRQLAFYRYYENKKGNYQYLNIDGSVMQGEQLENAKNADLDLIKHKPFAEFTPLKISYTGPLNEKGRPLTPIYDKFSVRAIVPELAYGRRDEQLMREMIKNDIDYIKFESGSKVFRQNPLTWVTKKGEGYDLSNFDVKIDNSNIQQLTSGFLKHQLGTFDKSFSNIYGTQFRKIAFDPAFKIATLIGDVELYNRLMNSYNDVKLLSDRLMRIQENDLFNLLGIEKISKGKENGKDVFKYNIIDFEKFIKVLKEEGMRQNFTINGIDYLEYDPKTRKAKWDLEFAFNRREIQELLSGMMDKKLRKLKLYGRSLIQVSGIGWEKSGDEWEGWVNAKDIFKKATDEQLTQFGSNDLPYYDIIFDDQGNPIRVGKMGIKIPLIGDFENLLNLNYPGTNEKIKVTYINSKGNRVVDYDASVKRLNQAMKNAEWKEKHMDKFTIIGNRIPTTNEGFIDHMEVMEFLPSSAGNIIIAPMEQIIKSGSDFDIDNMKMIFPSISKDGSFITEKMLDGIKDQEIFDRIRALSLTEQEIRDLKRSLTDKLKLSKDDIKNLSKTKSELASNIISYMSSLEGKIGVDIIEQALYNYFSKKIKDSTDPKSNDIIRQNIQKAKKRMQTTVFFDEEEIEKRESIIDILVKEIKNTRLGDITFEEYHSTFVETDPGTIPNDAIEADQYYRILKEIEELETENGFSLEERSNYGVDLEVFEKRNILVKSITNSIIKEYSALMSEPLYYEHLISPTTQDSVDDVANELIAAKKNYSEVEMANFRREAEAKKEKLKLFDPKSNTISNMSHVKEYEIWDFIMGKRKDLGGWAIHRTNSSIFNFIKFTMNNQFTDSYSERKTTFTPLIPRNRRSEFISSQGDIKMYGRDLNGVFIGDTLDQLVSATIDLVNAPAYPYLGINKLNKKIAAYLVLSGVPLKEVSFFLNQPILEELYSLFEEKSRSVQGYSLKHALVELAQRKGMLKQGYVSRWNPNFPRYEVYTVNYKKNDDESVTKSINTKLANNGLARPYSDFNDYLSEDLEFSLEQLDREIRKGKDADEEFQKKVLAYFGSIFEESAALMNLEFSYNTDTTKYATIQSITKNLKRKEEIKKNDIFKLEQIVKLETQSMIAPFDYTERGKDILMQLFPKLYSEQNMFAFEYIMESTFGNNEHLERVSKMIDNDYIEYIYKNFGKYKGVNFSEYFLPKIKNFEDSKEFFAIKFNEMIKRYPEIRDNVLFFSRLNDLSFKLSGADFTEELNREKGYNTNTRIWNIYLDRDSENSVNQRNEFIIQWRNLINFNPLALGLERQYSVEEAKEISEFFTELAYFSLYQSGATNVGDNFSDLIPLEIWTSFITEAIEQMEKEFSIQYDKNDPSQKTIGKEKAYERFMKYFRIKFIENNPLKSIKWNSLTYEGEGVEIDVDPDGKRFKKKKTEKYIFDNLYYKGKDYYTLDLVTYLDTNSVDIFEYLRSGTKTEPNKPNNTISVKTDTGFPDITAEC